MLASAVVGAALAGFYFTGYRLRLQTDAATTAPKEEASAAAAPKEEARAAAVKEEARAAAVKEEARAAAVKEEARAAAALKAEANMTAALEKEGRALDAARAAAAQRVLKIRDELGLAKADVGWVSALKDMSYDDQLLYELRLVQELAAKKAAAKKEILGRLHEKAAVPAKVSASLAPGNPFGGEREEGQ